MMLNTIVTGCYSWEGALNIILIINNKIVELWLIFNFMMFSFDLPLASVSIQDKRPYTTYYS